MISAKTSTNRRRYQLGQARTWVKGATASHGAFDERVFAVFQADILIPEQFLATFRRTFYLSPEKTLMFAILQDAVLCFQEYVHARDHRRRMLFDDAEQWILQDNQYYLFSFENICEMLRFDPSFLRRGLMDWKNKALAFGDQQRRAS